MNHGAESGAASEEDILSLRTTIFATMGAAAVLCVLIYSFIAVGAFVKQQASTPVDLAAKIDSRGRPSSDHFVYDGPRIYVKHEMEGAASEKRGGSGLAYDWRDHWDYGWDHYDYGRDQQ